MSNPNEFPDTLSLCSFFQFNCLENSIEKNLNTFYTQNYQLSDNEINNFANLNASLFPNYLSEWKSYNIKEKLKN